MKLISFILYFIVCKNSIHLQFHLEIIKSFNSYKFFKLNELSPMAHLLLFIRLFLIRVFLDESIFIGRSKTL